MMEFLPDSLDRTACATPPADQDQGRDHAPETSAEQQARQRTALQQMVEHHSRLVYRVAYAVVRNPEDAEDVVQETFLQLLRGSPSRMLDGAIGDERGYLARAAWRLAVRRHSSRKRDQQLDRELPPQMASLEPNPEQSAMESELEAWLHASIDRLPEKLRQPLALSALGELKLVEIAGILGLPDGTVRRRIHTARQILRRQLEKRKG
jgi:RNA polymerase sigma-70 factor (ECF subfamily)